MSFLAGRNAAVKLGSTTVVGVGSWELNGVATDLVEVSAFGDSLKQYMLGMQDGGTITFSGTYDPADSTGQTQLRTYNEDGTEVTSIRFYIDANSYWTPTTTNPASYVLITDWSITASQADSLRMSFTAKVSGKLELI